MIFSENRFPLFRIMLWQPRIPPPDLSCIPFEPRHGTTVLQVKANTKTSRSEEIGMTRRDQELLDRQLRGLQIQPRRDGTMILAIVAVFLAGIFLGNLRSQAGEPVHFNTVETALSAPSGSNPTLTVVR
jgi:hypothetical protein